MEEEKVTTAPSALAPTSPLTPWNYIMKPTVGPVRGVTNWDDIAAGQWQEKSS